MARGQTVLRSWLKGTEADEPDFTNSIPMFVLEQELVLSHKKVEIEDSLYFLQKRGYLIQHGHIGLTRVVFQLSEIALKALDEGHFNKEEKQAFKEDLFDLKNPGWFGMKFNLGELYRRFKSKKIK